MEKRMDEMDIFQSWVEVGMVSAAVLGGICLFLFPYFYSTMLKKQKLFNRLKFDWSTHTQLHETLTELRVKTDCARTQIIQFHNGGEFLDGISMQKMSLTHESLASGTSSEMEIKKDLLLSMCIEGLTLLKENKSDLHIVEMLDDSWCKKFMQSSNIISFSFLPIRKGTQIVGYVMCQWCSWSKTDSIDEKQASYLLEAARDSIEFTLEHQKSISDKK
tara:strand:- start:2318 stop:2971 length:654 start_codon:yes stop_codon:yes gene_type:complete